jgi:ribosomal protein L25 (general stress protein Ctc)
VSCRVYLHVRQEREKGKVSVVCYSQKIESHLVIIESNERTNKNSDSHHNRIFKGKRSHQARKRKEKRFLLLLVLL